MDRRPYTFWSPWREERVDATISGVPIGAELRKTVAAIVKGFDPEIAVDLLYDLWQAGAWADLERLSLQTLTDWGTRDSHALLLYGAALCEQQRGDEGMKCVREYGEKWITHWTTNFAAIAMYYEGQRLLSAGHREEAAGFFADAYGYSAEDRIAQAIEDLGRPRPQPPVLWVGKTFPARYECKSLVSGQTVGLDAALQGLEPGRVLLVCLLASYRGNGPYNDFMDRYIGFANHFGELVSGLHVLTMTAERRADRAYWFENEDEARAQGLPLEVLHDAEGEVTSAVEPTGSPFVVALDRSGSVLVEGAMDQIDLWNALAKAERNG